MLVSRLASVIVTTEDELELSGPAGGKVSGLWWSCLLRDLAVTLTLAVLVT